MEWTGPGPGRVLGSRARLDLVDDAQHILLTQNEVLLVLQLDLGAGVLAEEDAVAGLHVQRDLLAVIADLAVAHGDDLRLLRLFLGSVRNDDATLLHFLLLEPFNEYPIVQGTNL